MPYTVARSFATKLLVSWRAKDADLKVCRQFGIHNFLLALSEHLRE
jgi:hypothetical protein